MSSPKLLDLVRTVARLKHYSHKTEKAYTNWIKRFILFHNKRHPNQMGEDEIRQFLAHLTVDYSSPPLLRRSPSARCYSCIAIHVTEVIAHFSFDPIPFARVKPHYVC